MIQGFELILEGLGVNKDSDHFASTPQRAAHAWYYELCGGLTGVEPEVTTFPTKVDEMIALRGIPIRSLCAHHLLPFIGTATIAYVPGRDRLLGLSKLSRIANYWSRRPQVQEELTNQIANHIAELVMEGGEAEGIYFGGVGVLIQARHMCMELRGVNHSGDMITSAVRGVFKDDTDARHEFLRIAGEL